MPTEKSDSFPVAFNLEHVSFNFEAHEGKNISDSIGSIVKSAFQRSIAKSDQGLTSVHEILEISREVRSVLGICHPQI